MTLKEAIELVGNDFYKKMWSEDYEAKKQELIKAKKFEEDVLKVSNKDAFIHYDEDTKRWELYHRFFPWAQIATAEKLENFKNKDFWRDQLRGINHYTKIKNNNPYFSRNVGWGSPIFKVRDKKVMAYHGVDEKTNYYGTFCEVKHGRIVASIQDPLLKPSEEDVFIYTDKQGEKHRKGVIFPTAALVDEPADKIYVYFGSGDKRIKVRSTRASWVYDELNNPANKVAA